MTARKPLHIFIISSWFPSDSNPTNGSFVYEQAHALKRKGHKISVLIPNLSGSALQTLRGQGLPAARHSGMYQDLKLYRITQPVRIPFLKVYYGKLLYKACLQYLESYIQKEGKPDLIHSHAAFMGGTIAARLSRDLNIPLVHTEHTSGLIFRPEQYNAADRKNLKDLVQQASHFLFVSSFAMEKTLEKFPGTWQNARVLHNLVDPFFFRPKALPPHPFRVLCIARYHPMKNHLFLLEVWERFVQQHPDSKLILAGQGIDSVDFATLVRYRGLDDSVSCLPALSREGVYKQLTQAHVLVSASVIETFGLTIAEALAAGRPVVATNSGGPADIISEGDGFLIDQTDSESFAEALLKVQAGYHDPPDVISERCRQRFGEEHTLSSLENLYRKL